MASSQTPGQTAFPLVKAGIMLDTISAPSRIRTCAHGSGGRCSLP
jgi:hypothetical protein